ncbi:flavodoxin family protein [Spirosoma sp. HMF4905]|uniref:Flavodoxin family protein n=1 Tax=Spirosoma arboris TaxID=2682092 RepID=A0A7K1S5K8_9BACT|nr:NAD(P)H-dependent oxidoreductase [Spirosoma arboris]MVM29113.1 flavodoxin family protein [Spirosoma arboris]
MNVFIVYAHPSKKSYTYQVLKQLTDALLAEKHHVELSDLYDMNFLPDMTEEEYEREGFSNLSLPISEDVLEEHRKIEKADCLLFLYPVWWSDCPAKLKGWFDRVYSVGYAYGYDENGQPLRRMKTLKLGLVVCTAGHPTAHLTQTGIAQSMRTVMLDDRLGKRFDYKKMVILGGTLALDQVREDHSKQIRELVNELKDHLM